MTNHNQIIFKLHKYEYDCNYNNILIFINIVTPLLFQASPLGGHTRRLNKAKLG